MRAAAPRRPQGAKQVGEVEPKSGRHLVRQPRPRPTASSSSTRAWRRPASCSAEATCVDSHQASKRHRVARPGSTVSTLKSVVGRNCIEVPRRRAGTRLRVVRAPDLFHSDRRWLVFPVG
jgi:hypothetical protein